MGGILPLHEAELYGAKNGKWWRDTEMINCPPFIIWLQEIRLRAAVDECGPHWSILATWSNLDPSFPLTAGRSG